MAVTEKDNPGHDATGLEAVIFVHASGKPAITHAWLEHVLALNCEVFSHRELRGCTRTRHDYRHLGELLAELSELAPRRPVILLRYGLLPERRQIGEISGALSKAGFPLVTTVLSNARPDLNPFAGLAGTGSACQRACSRIVRLLGHGQQIPYFQWPDHVAALSPEAVAVLARSFVSPGNALALLLEAGGSLQLPDRIYVGSQLDPLFSAPRLEPHESLRPPAFGYLGAGLQAWLDAGAPELPPVGDDGKPITLHISHSWGGGVSQWVRTFIAHDTGSNHLQLISEAPQSNQGYGQRLSLYASNRLDAPLARWWLQPPIQSVAEHNGQYRQVLDAVRARFGIGRIIVSSLVGHSLDALRTGLPTVQVLHDYFPVWPLLGVHPEQHTSRDGAIDLGAALEATTGQREFTDRGVDGWLGLRRAYFEALRERNVAVVAPSRSVAELQHRLDRNWQELEIRVIPHGFPPLGNAGPVQPRARQDDRLRMVVMGRVIPGKGQSLLLQALPELTRHVHVYLLGTGKNGEAFFGMQGVDVVIEYDRDELPGILHGIGPHFAALLSVVPETFSYTLSELRYMGVPAIATNVGSFPDRIKDGVDGWLIEPSARAFADKVEELCGAPEAIARARRALAGVQHDAAGAMVDEYNRICPAEMPGPAKQVEALDLAVAQASSDAHSGLMEEVLRRRAEQHNRDLASEIARRTDWALDTQEALDRSREHARLLQGYLEQNTADLERARDAYEQTRRELDEANAVASETQSALQTTLHNLKETSRTLAYTQNLQAEILASTSWRITRPFRVLRRTSEAFLRGRAWNPLRWPLLLARLVHNIATVGLRGTLMRMQYSGQSAAPDISGEERLEPIGDPRPPAAVPSSSRPEVSIVIPAYNNWIYTAACLRAVAETAGALRLEVILVDDASTDDTQDKAAAIQGLRYIRNDDNQGFIGSCNRGAGAAKGEFIVLLNNDTQVLEGWLDALLWTFRMQPDAGLVGAKLVYPDGSLQECGGLLFRDGSGWNFGRGDDPDRPKYQYLRETDYCSGACIMLRTELYRQLGGFDSRFAPAYYEDTDLAFRVRAAGHKVYVQPRATVIHHEGVTSGTDINSGAKRFQVVNQEKFLQRWGEVLQGHAPRIEDPTDLAQVRRARDHRLRGRVLIIDATTPEPDQDSGSVRLTRLMGCFRDLGYGVTFFADNRLHAGRYTRDLQDAGVEVLYSPWLDSRNAFFQERGGEFDFVLVSRHYVAVNYISLIKRFCPQARFIFDTVDLHYLREQRLAELENSMSLESAARQTRRSELSVIAAADAVLVVSSAETEVLARDAPDALVHVLSNIHEVRGSRAGFHQRKDLFFVGGYQHPPNIDAMEWFVGQIWPLIRAELPDARFHMIGSKAPEQIENLHGEGVVFHGYVEDLDRFLDHCRMAVAPLRYGAGVKGKVNMSMSHGQPVVATPMAIEGMHAEHGREILVAESEREFAAEVVRLYRDEELWNRLSAASLENVERYFSVAAAQRSLAELIRKLAQSRPAGAALP